MLKTDTDYVSLTYTVTDGSKLTRIINNKNYCEKLKLETYDDKGRIVTKNLLNIDSNNTVDVSLSAGTHKVRIKLKSNLTGISSCFFDCSTLKTIPGNIFVANK